jgi:hypothetical protein
MSQHGEPIDIQIAWICNAFWARLPELILGPSPHKGE